MHHVTQLNYNQSTVMPVNVGHRLALLRVRPLLSGLILVIIAAWILLTSWPGYALESWTQKRDAYIKELHDALKLDANQEKSWKAIQVQAYKLLQQQQTSRLQIYTVLDQELAQSAPDFSRVVQTVRAQHTANWQMQQTLQDARLALYATFTTEQKGIVRDAIKRLRHQAHRKSHE